MFPFFGFLPFFNNFVVVFKTGDDIKLRQNEIFVSFLWRHLAIPLFYYKWFYRLLWVSLPLSTTYLIWLDFDDPIILFSFNLFILNSEEFYNKDFTSVFESSGKGKGEGEETCVRRFKLFLFALTGGVETISFSLHRLNFPWHTHTHESSTFFFFYIILIFFSSWNDNFPAVKQKTSMMIIIIVVHLKKIQLWWW